MPTSAAFWDKAARKYARRPIKDEAAYAHTLERTRAHLLAEDRALELGCGTGATALKLASNVKTLLATDLSAEMIAIGEERLSEAGAPGNVSFRQATLGALEGEAFDAVLAFNLLHLLEDPAAEIRRIHALLPPGGRFISKTPCLAGRYRLFWPLIAGLRLFGKAPASVRFLKTDELEAMIADAGFEILETGDFPLSPPAHFVAAGKP